MKTFYSFLIIFLINCPTVFSQQLSYTPVNPNFGGNYLNYSWLLSSANAQNPFDDKDDQMNTKSLLDSFSDTVKRQILSQLTRNLFGDESGEGLDNGTIEIGGLIITFDDIRTGTIITIIDSDTGESTEIIL